MRILEQIKESIAQRFNKQKSNQPTTILKEVATQEPVTLQNTENDLLKRDEKQNLLEALNKEMTIEHPDGRKETHTILTDSILSKNSRAVIEVLKLSAEYGILEEILEKKIRIKHTDGKEITKTPLDYANTNCVEIAKIIKEFQDNLNIPTTPLVTTSTEIMPIKQEETNKSSEDLDVHQPINENSEQNSETNEQEPNIPNSSSFTEIKPCSRSNKVDINQANKLSTIALHSAIKKGYSDTVKYLVDKEKVDVNQADEYGDTSLHLAARNGHLDIVRYFVDEKEVDFNQVNKFGCTALHLADLNDHSDIVQYLEFKNNANKQAIRGAIITGITCSVLAAFAIAVGCVVANVRLSTLAIAGITVAAALAVGLVIGCITYIVSKPSSTMIDLDTQQHSNTAGLSANNNTL